MALKLDSVTPNFCTVFRGADHLGYVHRTGQGTVWKACLFERGAYRLLETLTFNAKERAAQALLNQRNTTA